MADTSTLEQQIRTLESLITGLHGIVFGIESMKDPDHALKSCSEGGALHEYIHTMIRLLPSEREDG